MGTILVNMLVKKIVADFKLTKNEFHDRSRSCFRKYCHSLFGTKEFLKNIMRKDAWKLKDKE